MLPNPDTGDPSKCKNCGTNPYAYNNSCDCLDLLGVILCYGWCYPENLSCTDSGSLVPLGCV